jgi:hypothetical protein
VSTPRDDRPAYMAAMLSGNHVQALAIERRHGLDGYPPDLVSVGLKAAAEGRDALEAVEAHIEESAS